MVFKNDRQRKAVMSQLRTYRVKLPVYTNIETVVKVKPSASFDEIMDKAVEKAEKEEPKVAWMYDEDSADASGMDLVQVIDPETDMLIPENDRPFVRTTVEELKDKYTKDIAEIDVRKDLDQSQKKHIKGQLKTVLDKMIKDRS